MVAFVSAAQGGSVFCEPSATSNANRTLHKLLRGMLLLCFVDILLHAAETACSRALYHAVRDWVGSDV